MTSNSHRALVLFLLALLMAGTRLNHFAVVPDASWAVFFIGGFYLRSWTRWAFPALMALAVLADWVVISHQGLAFWNHYCVSPAYGCLVPAYLAMWMGGRWLNHRYTSASLKALGSFALALVASVAVCHLIAQGGFYWTSANVVEPSFAGWLKNYSDWLLPYLGTVALYTVPVALLQWGTEQFSGTADSHHATR
ncbi:MAG: hypothetical protein LBL59_09495 [Xanthomonadaceae bacterium]|jgi:hypothetical protein|nr:hypothetical protein [Xanthomonadaceae bacterium]